MFCACSARVLRVFFRRKAAQRRRGATRRHCSRGGPERSDPPRVAAVRSVAASRARRPKMSPARNLAFLYDRKTAKKHAASVSERFFTRECGVCGLGASRGRGGGLARVLRVFCACSARIFCVIFAKFFENIFFRSISNAARGRVNASPAARLMVFRPHGTRCKALLRSGYLRAIAYRRAVLPLLWLLSAWRGLPLAGIFAQCGQSLRLR